MTHRFPIEQTFTRRQQAMASLILRASGAESLDLAPAEPTPPRTTLQRRREPVRTSQRGAKRSRVAWLAVALVLVAAVGVALVLGGVVR